jgi:DNA-binding transcriptional LysR family regulator
MHLSGIDLNLAVVLHALLEERSVSRAARRLGLSQSATSHALARLRTLLSDPILVRTRSGLAPTPRAESIAHALASALSALEQSLLSPKGFDPTPAARSFRLGAADYAEFLLLPPLLARMASAAPGVDLWAMPPGADLDGQLHRGELDVAIGLPIAEDRARRIRCQKLFDERFVCLVRQGHPLTRGKLTVDRFVQARHAFIAPRGRPGGIVDDALRELGLERRVALAVPHFLVAPHVLARTDLVLTVAERIARAFAGLLPLRIVEPPLALAGFSMAMLWHERNDADPAQRWFRSVIVEAAAELAGPASASRRPARRARKG